MRFILGMFFVFLKKGFNFVGLNQSKGQNNNFLRRTEK